MGRRVTSTTKGGRYMNPADQERKVERRRELKKNKKQRQMVRQAVLKSKDPSQLIEEMEKLDNIEFNPHEAPPISERVIQDKRNKLRETYVRVMSMFKQESQMEKFQEVKKNLQEYDRRKTQLEQHYVAVKFTREVDPGEIPLPEAAPPPLGVFGAVPMMHPFAAMHQQQLTAALPGQTQPSPFPAHLMLPGLMPPMPGPQAGPGLLTPGTPLHLIAKIPAQGILKKKSKSTLPPGVPLGPPVDLSDDETDAFEEGSEKEEGGRIESDTEEPINEGERDAVDMSPNKKSSKVRFNANDEAEMIEKDSRSKYKKLAKKMAAGGKFDVDDDTTEKPLIGPVAPLASNPKASQVAVGSMGRSLVSIPPPGLPLPPLGFGPRMQPPNVRMIPLPPPFMRGANFQRPFIGPAPLSVASTSNSSVISSGPVLSAPPTVFKPVKPAGPVIEAKAQLRNMQHEVTKFVPTGVKIKLERNAANDAAPSSDSVGPAPKSKGPIAFRVQASSAAQAAQRAKTKTTDDAYDDFMNEMKDLM